MSIEGFPPSYQSTTAKQKASPPETTTTSTPSKLTFPLKMPDTMQTSLQNKEPKNIAAHELTSSFPPDSLVTKEKIQEGTKEGFSLGTPSLHHRKAEEDQVPTPKVTTKSKQARRASMFPLNVLPTIATETEKTAEERCDTSTPINLYKKGIHSVLTPRIDSPQTPSKNPYYKVPLWLPRETRPIHPSEQPETPSYETNVEKPKSSSPPPLREKKPTYEELEARVASYEKQIASYIEIFSTSLAIAKECGFYEEGQPMGRLEENFRDLCKIISEQKKVIAKLQSESDLVNAQLQTLLSEKTK